MNKNYIKNSNIQQIYILQKLCIKWKITINEYSKIARKLLNLE